jgi:hypothetical protein
MSHPYPHVTVAPEEYHCPDPHYPTPLKPTPHCTTTMEQCGPPLNGKAPSGRNFCNGEISQPNGGSAQNIINNINHSQQ